MLDKKYKPIIEAARAGGEILKNYFGQNLAAEQKSMVADFKTKADEESEAVILQILKENYPNYNILAEEKGKEYNDSAYTLIIDPLDGTNNFSLGIAYFAISIALVKKDDIEFGLIYNPITNQMFYAIKNKGAYLNNKKIAVSNETDFKKATVGYTAGYGVHNDKWALNLNTKMNKQNMIKRYLITWCGALDLCLVALGRFEALINYDNEIYDFLAGKLIAKEAGAVITDFKGKKDQYNNGIFLASNNKIIHQNILDIL